MPEGWFDDAYRGTPPWDIGRPQPTFVELAIAGEIAGRVLDVGCGTGENALYLAERGLVVAGVDGSPRAIQKANEKAAERGLTVRFEVGDALQLPTPVERYDTVIDSGLFHVFSDEDRARFRQSLERVIRPGGRYVMMCFSEKEPGDWGPRRVTDKEIRETFANGWQVDAIRPSSFDTTNGPAQAWLAIITSSPPG
jgi:ubiquinone/menaquinone biosynthesis C-methylase UbiE